MKMQFFYYGKLEIYTLAEKYLEVFDNPWISVEIQPWRSNEIYVWCEHGRIWISELSHNRYVDQTTRGINHAKIKSVGTIASFFSLLKPMEVIHNPFLSFSKEKQAGIDVYENPIIEKSKGTCTFDTFMQNVLSHNDSGMTRMSKLREYNAGLYAQLVARECSANLVHAEGSPDLNQSTHFYCWLKKNWV